VKENVMPFDQLSEMSDNALLVAYANGMPQAAQILTERLMPKIFAQAFHRIRNKADAEDIAQESLLRLWRIAPDWQQDNAKVSTWLYQVVANLCIDRLRRKQQEHLDAIAEPADARPNATDVIQDQLRANALYHALAKLPDRQREAVAMRHLDSLSNPEIADNLQLSIEAVESLTARGKRKLSEILQSQKSELGYQND
jgi:RNA polymerase sigma factor (sigma-70 family)